MKICFHVYLADKEMAAKTFKYVHTFYSPSISLVKTRLVEMYPDEEELAMLWILEASKIHIYPDLHCIGMPRACTVAPTSLTATAWDIL